jgi:hypothetical protein
MDGIMPPVEPKISAAFAVSPRTHLINAPAFGRRCIPPGGVAPSSHIADILGRRALPAGRLAALGAAPHL